MSAGNAAKTSMAADAKTASWIEQAHHCEKLPSIDDCLPYRDLGAMWSTLVDRWADRPWMTYYPCNSAGEEPVRFTLGEFSDLIDRVAVLLENEYGISRGRTIALMTVNQPLTAAIYFAAWRLGARVVPISPAESDERIGAILGHVGANQLIVHTTCRADHEPLDRVLESTQREEFQRTLVLDGASRHAALVAGWEDFNEALEEADGKAAASLPSVASWDAEAMVLYPSVERGRLTGVVLTQKQLLAAAYGISQWHGIDEHTVMMSVLPLHRASEVILALVTAAFVGAEVVLNRDFAVEGFWRKLAEHDVNIVSVIPKFLHALMATEEEYDPEKLAGFRHFISRSQPLTVEAAGEFQDRFGLKIIHGYGLNETACYSCFLPVELEWSEHVEWLCDHEVPSVGMPIIVNDVDIHDANGKSLRPGEKGEIVARGHNIMAGYLNDPQANAEIFSHGWLHSGYEGLKLRSEDGHDYFFVTGQISGRGNS
ncbi:MAG TPA: AMP-binding protein [Phycisphaerae bacterium]|nr:AMP-binding protein [Phycisphaerae bacterium]